MTLLRFTVPGTPRPKGRHRYRIVKRKGAGMDIPNPPKNLELEAMDFLDAWRMGLAAGRGSAAQLKDYFAMEYPDPDTEREEARIAAYAKKAMVEQGFERVDEGPVALFVLAVFKIPASCSKAEAARRIFHTQKPDDDNLRKMCDALNWIVWADDAQVSFGPPMKIWSLTEESIRVWVVPLEQDVSSFDTMANWTRIVASVAKDIALAGRETQVRMEGVG